MGPWGVSWLEKTTSSATGNCPAVKSECCWIKGPSSSPGTRTADPADGQVCGEAAMLFGKTQRLQRVLQGRMQPAQRFAALARAQPQRPRPAGAGKRACPANLQFERLERRGRLLHGGAYLGDRIQRHFVEEFQCQVQVVRLDPGDLGPRCREDPDQLRRPLPDGSAGFDGDESANGIFHDGTLRVQSLSAIKSIIYRSWLRLTPSRIASEVLSCSLARTRVSMNSANLIPWAVTSIAPVLTAAGRHVRMNCASQLHVSPGKQSNA